MSDDEFTAKLASIIPAGRGVLASDIRLRISEKFAEIEAARDRGVSWQQIADLMAADGVRGLDGKAPTQSTVRALFHAERYARGGKRKKRRGSKPVLTTMPPFAARDAIAPVAKQPEAATLPEDGPARWMANAHNQIKQRCR